MDNRFSGFKLALGFVTLAIPLLSIAAYGGAVVARMPTAEKQVAVIERNARQSDEMMTGSVSPKRETSCKAGKIDITQRSSKFDFSLAFADQHSSVDEPAP